MVVEPGFAPEAWGRLLQQRFETLADPANVERVLSVGAGLASQLLPHRSIGEEPLDRRDESHSVPGTARNSRTGAFDDLGCEVFLRRGKHDGAACAQIAQKLGRARIFNTYGPRMHPNDGRVVSNFIVQALMGRDITIYGDGSQTRSLCYVDDLVDEIGRAHV